MHKVYGCHRPREGCKLHPVGIRRKAEFFQVVIVPVRGVSCIGKYAQKQPCDI